MTAQRIARATNLAFEEAQRASFDLPDNRRACLAWTVGTTNIQLPAAVSPVLADQIVAAWTTDNQSKDFADRTELDLSEAEGEIRLPAGVSRLRLHEGRLAALRGRFTTFLKNFSPETRIYLVGDGKDQHAYQELAQVINELGDDSPYVQFPQGFYDEEKRRYLADQAATARSIPVFAAPQHPAQPEGEPSWALLDAVVAGARTEPKTEFERQFRDGQIRERLQVLVDGTRQRGEQPDPRLFGYLDEIEGAQYFASVATKLVPLLDRANRAAADAMVAAIERRSRQPRPDHFGLASAMSACLASPAFDAADRKAFRAVIDAAGAYQQIHYRAVKIGLDRAEQASP